MFRKEALRQQYKSQEFGHSVIKQPNIINKAIMILMVIMLITIIAAQFITITAKQSYLLKISAENYQPLVLANTVVINQQLVKDGAEVNKNQPLANISIISSSKKKNKEQFLTAPYSGVYFHSQINSTIIQAYQPISYLLKNNLTNDVTFWLTEKLKRAINVGDLVRIQFNQTVINGKISMIFGEYIDKKGLKLSIKFSNNQYLTLLSPQSQPKLLLQNQPKTLIQLLK